MTSASRPTWSCMARESSSLSRSLARDPETVEQLAIEIRVADADHGAGQAGGVERGREHFDHLGGPLGRRGADELDPGLGELPHLAALRPDRTIGASQIADPEGRLGGRVAVGDQAGNRNRHVGAHPQQLAGLVEEAVGDRCATLVAAREHLLVLDRRRRHLAVAEALERLDQPSANAAAPASRRGGCRGFQGNWVCHLMHANRSRVERRR